MSGNYSVSLEGSAPWGFRLHGGKDFNMPLTISRLTDGGKAANAGITVGDLVLSIDGVATEGMNHLEAQNKIKACAGNLNMTLQKAASVPKAEVIKDQPLEIIKPVPITQLPPPTSPASSTPSPAYNKTARPFGAGSCRGVVNVPLAAPPKVASIPSASSAFTPAALTPAPPPQPTFPLASSSSSSSSPSCISPNAAARPSPGRGAFPSSSPSSSSSSSSPGGVTSSPSVPTAPQPSVYNTPINLYSNENACEVAMGQRRGLLESQGVAVQQNGYVSFANTGPTPFTQPNSSNSAQAKEETVVTTVVKKPPPPRVLRRPIVETDIHFYHVPSHGNASKERLIEDTEDWHPRTGTSQSRSFRILAQMTGTGEGESPTTESETGKNGPLQKAEPSELRLAVAPVLLSNGMEDGSDVKPPNRQTVCTQTDSKLERTRLGGPLSLGSAPHLGQPTCSTPSLQPTAPSPCPSHTAGSSPAVAHALQTADCASGPERPSSSAPSSARINGPTHAPAQSGGVVSDAPPTQSHAPPPGTERRAVLLNPLEFLPRGAPWPPTLTPGARSAWAADTVPAGVRSQARRMEGAICPSLLDALLITPVFKAPPLRLRKKKRHSTSALHLRKIKSDFPEETSSQVVKTMTKAPASTLRTANSGPTATFKPSSALGALFLKPGPQMGHVAPSFGMVTNSSPKVAAPERPVPRPHPKDEDSLVQRAEHIPAGMRTPMCAHCNMVIRGPFLVAMGKSWHPEEFNCAHCRTSLADTGFVEERESVYCVHCYEEFFAPTCGRCQYKILGEVINALKQSWHVSCFLCASCQQPIGNSTFHLEDGEPYCERDYYTLFGTSCRGCEFPIEAGDKFLEALGATWHDTCFVCTVCSTTLEGQAFFSKNGKPLCKKHAHTIKI